MSENNNKSVMADLWKYVIIAVAVVVSAIVLSMAYTEKHRKAEENGTITVTGLGEMQFTSDMISVQGGIAVNNVDAAEGYRHLMSQREQLVAFLVKNGVKESEVTFDLPRTYKNAETIWNEHGDYAGTRFVDYTVYISFVIESPNLDVVEGAAQLLPSLIEQGIDISVSDPNYFYTQLDSLKHDLISQAAADAYERAQKIAISSGAEIKTLESSRAGVFQITSVNGNEEFSAGGTYNTTSREKKARVTVHSVFVIKEK
jgi:hypothetical protein